MAKLYKDGNIVNVSGAGEADFLAQGYTAATQQNVLDVQNKAAASFAGATPGAAGVGDRDIYAQAARGAVVGGIPDLIKEPDSPSQGTETIRNDQEVTRADAENLLGGLDGLDAETRAQVEKVLNSQSFGQSDAGVSALNELNNMRRSLGMLNADESADVSAAGTLAGGKYHNLIQQAQIAKEQGMPKALIGAGQRGGLMSSQFAGAAAAFQTKGEDFFGAGGKLENIKSVYDRNISNLRSQQQQAIISAETLARQAIRTGKREDFDLLQRAYDRAESSHNEANKLAQEKLGIITGLQDRELAQHGTVLDIFQQQLDMANDIPAGETRTFTDPTTGEDVTITGIGVEDIDPFYTGANITSLMKEIPEGETRTLTDPNTGREFTLKGFAGKDKNQKIVQSTDDAGNTTVTTIDTTKSGPESIISQTVLAGVGKTKAAPISLTIRQETGALIGQISDIFSENKGDDGKVSAQTYGEQQDKYQRAGAGTAEDFKRDFPPAQFLNSDDPNALPYFQTSKDVIKDEEEEGDLFD